MSNSEKGAYAVNGAPKTSRDLLNNRSNKRRYNNTQKSGKGQKFLPFPTARVRKFIRGRLIWRNVFVVENSFIACRAANFPQEVA